MTYPDADVILEEIDHTKARIAAELQLLHEREEHAKELGGRLVLLGAALAAVAALFMVVAKRRAARV